MKVTALANTFWVSALKICLLTTALLSTSAYAFTDLNGKSDTINNHIGKDKWTIVEVWASDCHACRMHMPEMVEFDGKLKNARLLGVSVDGQGGIGDTKDFIAEYGIKFPTILTNPIQLNHWMEQSIGETLLGTPTFILFDPKGMLVAAQPGIVAIASLEQFIMENTKVSKKNSVEGENKVAKG